MTSLDELRLTFFDECSEALQQIEVGLTELREGNVSDDVINAVFRSVHSVKGGAGIFGFEQLVRFAHAFETVLDAMRSGKLSPTQEILDVLLSSSDVLSDLVTMSRAGDEIPADHGSECLAALEQIMGEDGGSDGDTAPAEFEDLDFMPIPIEDAGGGDDEAAASEDTDLHIYQIVFRPTAGMLKKANEPLFLLRELRSLGKLELVAETGGLPSLEDLDPSEPYVGWTGTLHTGATRDQVEEVFAFVDGDCELSINEITSSAAPANDSPPVVAALEDTDVPPAVTESTVAAAPATPAPTAPQPAVAAKLADAPAPAAKAPVTKPAATTTRVELEKIDRVVNMVGELVIAQAMLGQIVQNLPEEVTGRMAQMLDEVTHHTRELKDSVMSMRAQPVSSVFQRMPRLVRELASKTGKKVRLEMVGENTEIDRSIIERLGDPLTHIIRNSIDHGIEVPGERAGAGKNEEGTIRLAAEHRGGRIVIEVKDDGAGLNPERVLNKAREKGLVGADASLTEDEINNLIFLPGFSTAATVSDISGRGVGMDVVRRNIQDVGGRISLKSERGRGMTIQLALPLTLAVMDGMVIKVGEETYVVPMSVIVECLRPKRSDIHNLLSTSGMLNLRGNLVPIVDLAELLDLKRRPMESDERVVIITDAGEGSRVGIIVDELCGHQQVVIKSIEESYGSVPGVAGATILGNGRVAFILDVEKLSELSSNQAPPGRGNGRAHASAAPVTLN
jgi:two-component system, chemotaxis family, sensor kinase CheA